MTNENRCGSRVEFVKLNKSYTKSNPVLKDFSLSIAEGELLVLVGPSGCGKSTLLRILSGLEQCDSGSILISGREVNALTPQERNIAMVFQDYALYPHMTVRANLEFPLEMRRLSRDKVNQRVTHVASMLGLEPLLDRFPKALSGGQRQRVAMGRALVREPAVFLLDEPLSNLDAKLRVQMRTEIADLQRQTGTTMIYVTHDQVEAMTLGHRVAVLNHGELQQVAEPESLYSKPENTFVAGFIGNPPMNLFACSITQKNEDSVTLNIAGQMIDCPIPQGCQLDQQYKNQPLIAGLRAENLEIVSQATSPYSLAAIVETVELLGYETLVYLRLIQNADPQGQPEVTMIVRRNGLQRYAQGEYVHLHFDLKDSYFFSPNGKRLEVWNDEVKLREAILKSEGLPRKPE